MEKIFEISDKQEKKVYLSRERLKHVLTDHPELIDYMDEIQETIRKPLKITEYTLDKKVRYYYSYQKKRQYQDKYLVVIVKYLNGKGFIITAYFVRYIR